MTKVLLALVSTYAIGGGKMTTYDYDVLYIGSGHGTFDGAFPLGTKGVKVGVIEQDLIGGTCPNRGCNAKIVLD